MTKKPHLNPNVVGNPTGDFIDKAELLAELTNYRDQMSTHAMNAWSESHLSGRKDMLWDIINFIEDI
jgi:hypothetical protein